MRLAQAIIIKNGKVKANLKLSYSMKSLGVFDLPSRYKVGRKLKSRQASKMIDLRFQYRPFCHNEDGFDPSINEVIGKDGESAQDFVYKWHFAHRHNFPSEIKGEGRGQGHRIRDIVEHPLSYVLMCLTHHEEYDRENGDWSNPKKYLPDT